MLYGMIQGIIEFTAVMAEMAEACKNLCDALPKLVVKHPDPSRYGEQKMKPRAGYPRPVYWLRTRSNPYSRKRARQRAEAKQGQKQ